MPATDPDLTAMEDLRELADEGETTTNIPSSFPRATVPPSTLPDPAPTGADFTGSETAIETKAVSMASNDCSLALSSPSEASPAKPGLTSPTSFDGSVETEHGTSYIASASDSLTCTETSIVNISEPPSSLPVMLASTFGCKDAENEFSPVLSFKGVSVTLENNSVWKQFNSCGTEMILTKPGRRMFPYCRYRLAGLDPERKYSLVLSIIPSDQWKYRWSNTKWEITGQAENQSQGLIRAFSHHYSPCLGSEWMGTLVSFYKLKLTNNNQDQDGHLVLHSLHRYIPRLHVIPYPDGEMTRPTPDQPLVMGPECMTFTFPQTEFMAVTTYQNFRITQLKINHNPFAKGFREDGNNPRLNRLPLESQLAMRADSQLSVSKPAEVNKSVEEVVDLSWKNPTESAPLPHERATRLVLKPIMSTSNSKDEPYVPCIRGKHALGELVLVEKRSPVKHKEEADDVSETPEALRSFSETKERSTTPTSTPSTPESLPGSRRKKKRINRRWANSRGKEWKAAADSSPVAVHSPTQTVAMQPEQDDVEGLLFVSFTSKEALEVHSTNKPANSSSASPVPLTTPVQTKPEVEVIPETDEEKLVRLEAVLLQDLRVFKHRQVIHPVLQEVGLKLSALDPTMSIDLQYLGVHLPLPPPNLPHQDEATSLSPSDEGLPFISRTGKTRDMTKIKGWRNKFLLSKETSPANGDGSQKNLSAFCSNMLDEYLESEEQYISERAAAFSSNPEGSVAYRLPAKSSSYVKTLDSALKHRQTTSALPSGANRPCPLSHKPLLYSTLMSPPPPALAHDPSGAQTSPKPGVLIETAASGSCLTSLDATRPSINQRQVSRFMQSHGLKVRPAGLTKFQFKLLQLEMGAVNQGLRRTQMTANRVSVATSVLLTKQMLIHEIPGSRPIFQHCPTEGPECGEEFCRLGCVCSSLKHPNRGPLHCRRPECMLGCACFKRKIVKQSTGAEIDRPIGPVYSVANMEHVVQPGPASHVSKLWNRNIHDVDREPISAPESAPQCPIRAKVQKRNSAGHSTPPIREEDKDPVYKYLESMMTCARVREFNCKPPPVVPMPKAPDTSPPNTAANPQETTSETLWKKIPETKVAGKKAEAPPRETPSYERGARKQIEIQSACYWDKDRKAVLEVLCRRLSQDRLSQRFLIGPYLISPITKIGVRKPSGSTVTYRLNISKPSTASDNDEEEEFNDSDEDQHGSTSGDTEEEEEEEDDPIEVPEVQFGVTPFLSGLVPAGRLRARTKPVGCQPSGLIQVNGKSYNQARLLLGHMGSLHPANRLAAYITGRLKAPANVSHRNSQNTNKFSIPGSLHIKAAGAVVPPVITARKTTDLKTLTQAPVPLCHPETIKKEPVDLPQPLPQQSSNLGAFQSFIASRRSSAGAFQNTSTSSPVSLTVSQSLKTPSFLAQSGTYSFRICPPAANPSSRARNPPGVTLPGGFTLIQLPKPGEEPSANAKAREEEEVAPAARKKLRSICHLSADSVADLLRVGTYNGAMGGARGGARSAASRPPPPPHAFPPLTFAERMRPDQSFEALSRQLESSEVEMEDSSEELSTESSDYSADEDELLVDIETVEEETQGMAATNMEEAVRRALQDTSYEPESAREPKDPKASERDTDSKRKNHTFLERQRRNEQRTLFDRLQFVLRTGPRAPRLRLLSLATKEIHSLEKSCKTMEEEKRRLTQAQSLYVKQLSLLSGKSDKQIKDKLKEICERQKLREKKRMNWKPFFSQLLQSRAVLLQGASPRPNVQPTPILQPSFSMPPPKYGAVPHKTAAPNSAYRSPMPSPLSLRQTSTSAAPAKVTGALPRAERGPGGHLDQVQGALLTPIQGGRPRPTLEGQQETPAAPEAPLLVPKSEPESEDQIPVSVTPLKAPAAQEAASSAPSTSTPTPTPTPTTTPTSTDPTAPKPISLPLIRTKTGRIILPSSLKPIGNGFYTLMLMEAKKDGDEHNASSTDNQQPSDVNSSKNQEKSSLEPDRPSAPESSRVAEVNKLAQYPNTGPKLPGDKAAPPLAGLALLNKSISMALKSPENSPGGGSFLGLSNALSTGRLSFNQHHKISTSPQQPQASPNLIVRRPRGRPRRSSSLLPAGETRVPVRVEASGESETSFVAGKRLTEIFSPGAIDGRADGLQRRGRGKIKRGRGRPPKPESERVYTPYGRAESPPSRDSEYTVAPVRRSPTTTTSLRNKMASRPLTRGSLGKDFPSAKKRSWIDVEKELELEQEQGHESE